MKALASAPGKLVLLGEYAVLDGAPALVMAADRRASVRIQPLAGTGACRLSAPGQASAGLRFGPDGLHWDGPASAERYGLIGELLTGLAGHGGPALEGLAPFEAELDTRAFFADGRPGEPVKLGLGSSAALTVAFAAALLRYAGAPASAGLELERLLALHRRFQNGAGSGLDVAASLCGGLIAFQRRAGAPASVRRMALPDGLEWRCIWSGRATSTAAYVQYVRDYARREPRAYAAITARLGGLSAQGIAAAEAGETSGVVAAVRCYGQVLAELGAASGLAIVSEEHAAIARRAERHGAAYKPSGAGGGDVGIAVAAEPGRLEGLVGELEQAGFRPIPLRIDPVGVTTTVTE